MTIWLERARREIPKPLNQGAAKTDETWGFGSNGSIPSGGIRNFATF